MTKFFGILAAGGVTWFASGNFWLGVLIAVLVMNALGGDTVINRFTGKTH
jgi:hypothetical protein